MAFKKTVLIGLQLALAILSISVAAPSAFAQAKWQKLAPFPEPAEEILGAAAGGKMYVFAGLIPFWKPKGLVYEYDPATDHWTKKKSHGPSVPPRRVHGISRENLRVRRICVSDFRSRGVGADQQCLGV